MQSSRPSVRELHKRMAEAKEALGKGLGVFAIPEKAVGELNELEIGDAAEVWLLIRELLEEITENDYAGTRPPQKSYEKTIEGADLLAFSWHSSKLGKKMYLKFALKNGRYYYISLHQSRFTEEA